MVHYRGKHTEHVDRVIEAYLDEEVLEETVAEKVAELYSAGQSWEALYTAVGREHLRSE